MTTTAADDPATWWGTHRIPVGSVTCWRLGPLSLWIERQEGEWRVAYKHDGDPLEPTVRVEQPTEPVDLMSMTQVTRYAFGSDADTVHLTPVLADRPVISRPEKPFVVLPSDDITVYISHPLWVRIEAGEPRQTLLEVPTYRPSDTWFGPDTTSGEMCYASRTAMRLNQDQAPLRAQRALSAVEIRNRGLEPLTVERLNLPVVYLSLYRGGLDELWTQNVIFERPAGAEAFQLQLRETTGRNKAQPEDLLAAPRLELPDRVSVGALASLFS